MEDKERTKYVPERGANILESNQKGIILICPDVFYSKTIVKQILNISETAYSNYRKDGLLAHKIGMEVYTRGQELIDFILTRSGNSNLYTNEARNKNKRKRK